MPAPPSSPPHSLRHPCTPSVIPAPPPSSLYPLRHPCTPSVIPAPLRHPRTLPSSPHPSVMPAPPSSPPHSLRHPCTPSVIPAPLRHPRTLPSSPHPSVMPAPPRHSLPLRHACAPLVTPALPPSSLHALRHPCTPSVIPTLLRHPRTPSVIPAPPPSSLHPLRHPRTLPSFLRPLRHSCVGRNPCDHRTPVHAPGPRRPTETLEGAATRSGFRSDGAPSNVAVPLATPQNAWIPASRSFLPRGHACLPVIPAQAGIHATTGRPFTPQALDGPPKHSKARPPDRGFAAMERRRTSQSHSLPLRTRGFLPAQE